MEVIALVIAAAILSGILLSWGSKAHIIEHVNASTTEPVPVPVIVRINWTPERIEQEIRKTFPETPDLAVRVARCESGLVADIQSQHTLSYGQERSFGIFQVHEPDWGKTAARLGFENWRTDPGENIKLARYIYEQAGKRWTPWSCYTKKMI